VYGKSRHLEHGGKASFVADAGGVAFFGEDFLERMESLGTHSQGIRKSLRPDGHDHEFLEVSSTVQDVHHRHRQDVCTATSEISVERQPGRIGGGFGRGERNPQDGVCAKFALVRRAIK